MKPILINLTFILISISSMLGYKFYCTRKYGKKSSISAWAKPLLQDGNRVLTFLFVLLSLGLLVYVARTTLSTFAGMAIFGIGVFTGYDPEIKPVKLQDVVHVVLVAVGIGLFLISVILIRLVYVIPVGIWIVVSLYLWLKGIKHHTRIIEELMFYVVIWPCLLAERVILPLIDLI